MAVRGSLCFPQQYLPAPKVSFSSAGTKHVAHPGLLSYQEIRNEEENTFSTSCARGVRQTSLLSPQCPGDGKDSDFQMQLFTSNEAHGGDELNLCSLPISFRL